MQDKTLTGVGGAPPDLKPVQQLTGELQEDLAVAKGRSVAASKESIKDRREGTDTVRKRGEAAQQQQVCCRFSSEAACSSCRSTEGDSLRRYQEVKTDCKIQITSATATTSMQPRLLP